MLINKEIVGRFFSLRKGWKRREAVPTGRNPRNSLTAQGADAPRNEKRKISSKKDPLDARLHKKFCFVFVLFFVLQSQLAAQELKVEDVIARLDRLMFPNAKSMIELIFTDSQGRKETIKMTTYSKDRNQKVIVRFTAPSDRIGNDILMIDQNVWLYDNRSNRVIKVPSNQSFGGTGFSYADVVRLNLTDNYRATLVSQDAKEWNIDLTAKSQDAPYAKIRLTVDKQGGWPLKGICFAKNDAVIKELVYSQVGDAGSGRKPLVLTVTSPTHPGDVSVMRVNQEILKEIPPQFFNRRNLETRLEERL